VEVSGASECSNTYEGDSRSGEMATASEVFGIGEILNHDEKLIGVNECLGFGFEGNLLVDSEGVGVGLGVAIEKMILTRLARSALTYRC
jgi:hypothetical protein